MQEKIKQNVVNFHENIEKLFDPCNKIEKLASITLRVSTKVSPAAIEQCIK